MKEYLWRFKLDWGRRGMIDSVFVASNEDVDEVIGKEAWFGSVLGKHSEVYCTLEIDMFTRLTRKLPDEEAVVDFHRRCFGREGIGYNPLQYIEEEEEE